MWRIKNFLQFIKDIFYWAPKIWQDRDWDSFYLYQLMRWKIERIAKHVDKYSSHIGHKKDVRDMRICIELLKRIERDDVYDEMFGSHRKKKCLECKKNRKKKGFLSLPCDKCFLEFKKRQKFLQVKKKSDRSYLFQLLDKKADRWWT